MVKIISSKSLGFQSVYDIGVETDHNFLLVNGLVASNCFNKSHSTAYAYVTYQTAYLKANYPVEYMTALLTASSDNQDKVEKYRENCQKMGIDVQPPDINHSQKDFTPIGNKILFGLSAVRNLGEGAIENILKAREEAKGKFSSLANFCSLVDLRVVNRRALETLIYCGGFDKINSNRQQLIKNLDLVIPWSQKRAKEKESGQMNIFDIGLNNDNQNSEFDQAPSAPSTEDFSLPEKLKLEKEHLGFYVSEHPLKAMQKSAQILSPVNLSTLEEQKNKQKISAVVMITMIKHHTTKKGDPMAFLTLEDASGQSEGVVFPETYQRIKDLLREDIYLIIWGKIDMKDEKVQILIDDAEMIDNIKMVMINLTLEQATNRVSQNSLKGIIQEQSGDKSKAKTPIIAIIGKGKQRQFVRLGLNYWVQNETTTVDALNHAGFDAYQLPLMSGLS
ncbi:OB-fold nucleic acid binding domain-containing protein [Aphanothece sacrum]|uniref:DNA polymerase III subunit alpha n=1 Tax=Aphanothece sacrum FPU1 TaxID=1920663 RepID=A0A401ILR2_APHSA|nr:OB-fold nucleic acid binding domain-containing protein [Aphanothece sacrum]GBF82189.1 DNA polymerase III subunit alpha [Aphanothece sacrum FPU1]GBF87273.1 DNA polymerase III subunit alpha [Aphanothece sacrum FPU3]